MAMEEVKSPKSMRDNVAREILESEKTFVDQMQILVKVFAKPLKWWAQELTANYGKVRASGSPGRFHVASWLGSRPFPECYHPNNKSGALSLTLIRR